MRSSNPPPLEQQLQDYHTISYHTTPHISSQANGKPETNLRSVRYLLQVRPSNHEAKWDYVWNC
jgi:hypothetical protein